jgi:hypothetical protein
VLKLLIPMVAQQFVSSGESFLHVPLSNPIL